MYGLHYADTVFSLKLVIMDFDVCLHHLFESERYVKGQIRLSLPMLCLHLAFIVL